MRILASVSTEVKLHASILALKLVVKGVGPNLGPVAWCVAGTDGEHDKYLIFWGFLHPCEVHFPPTDVPEPGCGPNKMLAAAPAHSLLGPGGFAELAQRFIFCFCCLFYFRLGLFSKESSKKATKRSRPPGRRGCAAP